MAEAGVTPSGSATALVYRNGGDGTFTDISAGLTGVYDCALAWGDYDNDGDLDLAVAGNTNPGRATSIYRNNGDETFTNINAGLAGVRDCSLAWADFDNDGSLDLAVAGASDSGFITRIYRNNGSGSFSDIGAGLPGVYNCSLAWGDYDNDGYQDLAVAGYGSGIYLSSIYHNNAGASFSDIGAGLTGVTYCSLAWADFDNDGDLDLALMGYLPSGLASITKIYRNDGSGTFTDIDAGLTTAGRGSLAWGDYNNDGYPDLAVSGYDDVGGQAISIIFRNNGNESFTNIAAGLIGSYLSCMAWGDFNNDGYLDLSLTGTTSHYLYRNDGNWGTAANTAPNPPATTGFTQTSTDVTLSWSAGSDNETPASGLSYNIMIGTSQGAVDISSPMANPTTGFRKISALGPRRQAGGFTLAGLTEGQTYWWGVQAIDTALAGSSFKSGGFFIFQNFPPVPGDFSKTGPQDQDIAFTPTDFSDHLTDEPADELTQVRIATLPAQGELRLSGTPVTTGAEIAYTQTANLTLAPDTGWHGDTSFTWQARDTAQWSTASGTVSLGVGPPVVATGSLTRSGAKTVLAAGTAGQAGMGPVTDRGFQCSYGSTSFLVHGGTGLGAFSSAVTGPAPGLTHRVRAFATNTAGTSYGAELSFVPMDPGSSVMGILLAPGRAPGGADGVEAGPAGVVAENGGTGVGDETGSSYDPLDKERKKRGE